MIEQLNYVFCTLKVQNVPEIKSAVDSDSDVWVLQLEQLSKSLNFIVLLIQEFSKTEIHN